MILNCSQSNRLRAVRNFKERVQSMLTDGYHVQFQSISITSDLLWCSLRHHNGNRVTLYGYVCENKIVQRTNHIVTHTGTLY